MSDQKFSDDATRRLFLERLPWYVNGTLAGEEREWMEHVAVASPWAGGMLERERELAESTQASLAFKAGDLGLSRLIALARETPQQASASTGEAARGATLGRKPSARSANPSWLQKLTGFLSQPQFALATVTFMIAQTAVIGWLASAPLDEASGYRSTGVSEMRTLRVTFVNEATEPRIRAALLSAGARVVGGPNQLGEYWIASSMKSLDEVKDALQSSGLVASIAIDLAGPRGQ